MDVLSSWVIGVGQGLSGAILALLLRFYGWVHSWALGLLLLALVAEILRVALARLLMLPLWPVNRRREDFTRRNSDLGPEELQRLLARGYPLPGWAIPLALFGTLLDLLLAGAFYLGLYLCLRDAPALRGAPLLWWRDMAAPAPYYIPAAILLALGLVAVVVPGRDRHRRPTYLLLLITAVVVPLAALAPVGLVYYGYLNLFSVPKYCLVTALLPFMLLYKKLRRGQPESPAPPEPTGPRRPPARPTF